MNSVYNFLENLNINTSGSLIVAVSYGPDSMALLDILSKFYKNNKIICAHVHHNHRKESDDEAEALKKYCQRKKICFEMMKIQNYKNNKFTENEARLKRYSFFDNLVKKYNAKFLFTAHHGDDLVETILMRLVRGSSLNGYAGIAQKTRKGNYYIVRPLLYITKSDILNYCNKNNIPYANDVSNDDMKYTRNRFRKLVLPILKKENNDVHLQFLKFSKILREYETYFDKITYQAYDKVILNKNIDINKIKEYDGVIIKRILQKFLLDEYKEDINVITDKNLNELLSLINSNSPNKILSMPLNKRLVKSYNKIFFDNLAMYNDYCYIFNDFLELPNGYIIEKVNELDNNSNFISAFDSKELKLPLYVRNKLDGDKIEVLGLNGTKKIKDVFIDSKVSKLERKIYPVVADSAGRIIWLPGLKKTKYDKSKTGKYDIILKYYREEKNDTAK